MNNPPQDLFHAAILKKMEAETLRIVEEESENAANRVRERVRGLAGSIATEVATWVSYDTMRNELRITVKIPERG